MTKLLPEFALVLQSAVWSSHQHWDFFSFWMMLLKVLELHTIQDHILKSIHMCLKKDCYWTQTFLN